MKIEMTTTIISVPDGDLHDIEVIVKRENDLIVVGFYGYAATDRGKRYGWEVNLTPEKAELLLRGLQDLAGPAHSRLYDPLTAVVSSISPALSLNTF